LTQLVDPPEVVLQQCRALIDRKAPAGDRENLLAIAQVLAGCGIMILSYSRSPEGFRP
jgi:hypothetical protein